MKKYRPQIMNLIKLIAVAALMLHVVHTAGGIEIWGSIKEAKVAGLLLSALAFFLSILLGSYQWYYLLKIQHVSYSVWQSFKTYYSGMFINAAVFNLAGDALRVHQLKKSEADMAAGFSATFMDRFMGFFILSVFSLVSVTVLWSHGELSEIKLIYLSLGMFLIFLMGALILSSRRFGTLFQVFLRLIGLRKFENHFEKTRECMLLFRRKWVKMIGAGFLSAGVHSLRILGHYLCAVAFGVEISIYYFFCFVPLISLATIIPLNLGGWGVPQVFSMKLYALNGVIVGSLLNMNKKEAAGLLAVVPSGIFYLVMLCGGVFILSEFINSKLIKNKGVHS